ncbi:hypothetical protein [Catellatospora sichuanensis]|uniref:hypothetical protein n=1 Tax=Catellatospora sichuanensis TaxID=1969805 RepID=UPI0011833A63|nr:hypothetical protein [Catellatospora sichuanensis]
MRYVRAVQVSAWLLALGVGAPLLALGLERSGAIFGTWGDWPEWWRRDMLALAVGMAVWVGALAAGLTVSAVHRRWPGTIVFGLVLVVTLTAVGIVHGAHPERFADIWDQVLGEPPPDF